MSVSKKSGLKDKGNADTLSKHPEWSFALHQNHPAFKTARKANHEFLRSMVIGLTLNICCGADPIGHVKADIDEELLRHLKKTRIDDSEYVVCDVMYPPFRDGSFDTVVCDPPFKFYNKFKWIRRLLDLARKRVILSVPPINIHLGKTDWEKELYYTESSGISLRLWWVFTRREQFDKT